MASHDPGLVPAARVVRQSGVAVAPPRVPLREQLLGTLSTVGETLLLFLSYAVGLWPLTAVVLLAGALLWAVGFAAGP